MVGYFRRDYLKIAGRIKAIKITIIRFQEPLPKGRKYKELEPESELGPEAPSSENKSKEEISIKDTQIMSILEIS